jgi:hypothetical protein
MRSRMARREFPDDLKADVIARLATDYRNGNWCEAPWFLERENEWLRDAGYPLETRCRLVAPLAKLYPADVCKKLLLRPLDAGIVFGFFHQWPPLLIPVLDVGEDVAVVPAALKTSLLRKLRKADDFSGAAAELRVWASLVRAGFTVDYEPSVLSGGSVRHPDFGVRLRDDYYLIEVSELQTSAWSKAARILEERLVLDGDAFFEDRLIRILPSPEFLAGTARQIASLLRDDDPKTRDALMAFLSEHIVPPVRETLELVRARSAEPGSYPVEGIGRVEVTVKPGKEAVSELMPPLPPNDVARRVLRKVLEEAGQLQPGRRRLRRGVVVLEMGRAASIVPVARALARLVARGKLSNLDRLDNVDALLLRGTWQKPDGQYATAVHPIINSRVADARPSPAAMDVFYALGGGWLAMPNGNDIRIRSQRGEEYQLEGPVVPQHDD